MQLSWSYRGCGSPPAQDPPEVVAAASCLVLWAGPGARELSGPGPGACELSDWQLPFPSWGGAGLWAGLKDGVPRILEHSGHPPFLF